METNGGFGVLYESCYYKISSGVVFEKDDEKIERLSKQRQTWFVYQADCLAGIEASCGGKLGVNFVDVDPYGDPWPIIECFMKNKAYKQKKIAIAVNDGLRQMLKMNGGWKVGSIRDQVKKHGNSSIYKNYIEICKEKMSEIAEMGGYKVDLFGGYYCGAGKNMTHYGVVLSGY